MRSPHAFAALFVTGWLCFAHNALAQTADENAKPKAVSSTTPELPFYKGDHLRFGEADIFMRSGASFVGSILEVGHWDREAWLMASSTAAVTISLMAPTDPSPDVRMQAWVQGKRTPAGDTFMPVMRTPTFRTYGLGSIGLLGLYGYVADKPGVLEAASLSMEAVTVAVSLHLAQKLLIGREGPTDGDGLGIIYGPAKGIYLYPAGTPSGHTASVWSMSVVLMDQVDTPVGYAIGWTINGYVAVSLVYNDQHYVSDVIWGAPLGYFVGKWVSKHRSTRYTYKNGQPASTKPDPKKISFSGVSPLSPDEHGTRGIAAVWLF